MTVLVVWTRTNEGKMSDHYSAFDDLPDAVTLYADVQRHLDTYSVSMCNVLTSTDYDTSTAQYSEGTLQSAAYLMCGLANLPTESVCESWGHGHLSLVAELMDYAPMADRLCESYPEHPGVFDYEVTEPFGEWFGRYVLEHNNVPDQKVAKAQLVMMSNTYFNQPRVTP